MKQSVINIPLNRPYWGIQEEQAVVRALRTSNGIGDGPYSRKFSRELTHLLGSKFVFPVPSCTHAMDIAMAVLGIGPGDEVIVPSFTMTSSANCILLRGATPVFADIEDANYTINPDDITRVLTKKTRGIMVVHYAGMPCRMDKILALAKQHNLFVVEDAAHAIGATWRGKALGTYGTLGAFSFHGTKNVSCGEGGALVTNEAKLATQIEIYRANGTNRNAYLKGIVPLYHWVGPGSSYFLSDLLASILHVQLKRLKTILAMRLAVAAYYTNALASYRDRVTLPLVPPDTGPNWHIYALRFKTADHRKRFMKYMRQVGIEVSTHYVPLHTSPMGRRLRADKRSLPITDHVADTLVRLPIYPDLTKKQLRFITAAARKALEALRQVS